MEKEGKGRRDEGRGDRKGVEEIEGPSTYFVGRLTEAFVDSTVWQAVCFFLLVKGKK